MAWVVKVTEVTERNDVQYRCVHSKETAPLTKDRRSGWKRRN